LNKKNLNQAINEINWMKEEENLGVDFFH